MVAFTFVLAVLAAATTAMGVSLDLTEELL